MQSDLDYATVLSAYPDDCRPRQVDFLGAAGGFSGARFWRLITPRGTLCLRRWPQEHPSPQRLEFIQAVLWHVSQEGFRRLPLPLETRSHAGYVRHAGHFWELTPWMPGAADYLAAPSTGKLEAAMTALAQFHTAAASFPLPESGSLPSPAIRQRVEQLSTLAHGGIDELEASLVAAAVSQDQGIGERARRICRLFARPAGGVLAMLENCRALKVPQQPCIRDIWHDHVLFQGNAVSSLIDFGAMRPESVAADAARLLGSLARDDPDDWANGLAAYESVRPLTEAEALLVTALDRSTVLMSGLNWIEWLFVQRRQFDDLEAVAARMDEILLRLEFLHHRELG